MGKQRLCALSFSWAAAGSVTGGPRASASAAVPAPRRGRHLKRRFADRTPDPPNQRLRAGPGARILTGRAGGPSLLPPPGVRFGGSAWGPSQRAASDRHRARHRARHAGPAPRSRGGRAGRGRPAGSGPGQPGPSADGSEGRRSPGRSPVTHGRGSGWGRRVWAAARRQN